MNKQAELMDSPFAPQEMPAAHLRDLVLRRLVDLATLPIGRISGHERSLVDSVLAPIVSRLDRDTRIKLAKRLAVQPEGPRQLIFALAQDEFAVAEPLLLDSQTLQSAELIHIMRLPAPAHRLAIASRRHLASDAADALAEYDDEQAVCRLLSNMNVHLSAMAMEGLVRRSASYPAYQPLLLARPEMSVRCAQVMFWWASPAHRLEILTRFATERRVIHDTMEDVLEQALHAGNDEALASVLALVRTPVTGDKVELARLLSYASREGEGDFAHDLALFARIRTQTSSRIITDMSGEPLAVLAKALSLSRKEMLDLWSVTARFRPGGSIDDIRNHEWLSAIFDGVSIDRADFALHCWDYSVAAEPIVPAPTLNLQEE